MIDWQLFCRDERAAETVSHTMQCAPWVYKGHKYATDGAILVRHVSNERETLQPSAAAFMEQTRGWFIKAAEALAVGPEVKATIVTDKSANCRHCGHWVEGGEYCDYCNRTGRVYAARFNDRDMIDRRYYELMRRLGVDLFVVVSGIVKEQGGAIAGNFRGSDGAVICACLQRNGSREGADVSPGDWSVVDSGYGVGSKTQ